MLDVSVQEHSNLTTALGFFQDELSEVEYHIADLEAMKNRREVIRSAITSIEAILSRESSAVSAPAADPTRALGTEIPTPTDQPEQPGTAPAAGTEEACSTKGTN